MGALISGFSFTVNVGTLLLAWGIAALAYPVFALLHKGKGLYYLIVPMISLLLWNLHEIVNGARGVISYISYEYNRWMFTPLLYPGMEATVEELTVFFAAAGVGLACLLYVAICLWRSSFTVVLVTAPLVFLTFVLVYVSPNPVFLVGLLGVYIALLITNAMNSGGRIKPWVAMLTGVGLSLAVLIAAFFLMPPDNYSRDKRLDNIGGRLRSFAAQVGVTRIKTGTGWPAVTTDGVWQFNTEKVGVADAGTRTVVDNKILGVNASGAGTFYLKGYTMQRFDGRTWSVNSDSLQLEGADEAAVMPVLISSVYNRNRHNEPIEVLTMTVDDIGRYGTAGMIAYTPYYSIPQTQGTRSYQISFYYTRESITKLLEAITDVSFSSPAMARYNSLVLSDDTYLQIDEDVAGELRRIARDAGIDEFAGREEVANQVIEYVSSVGSYNLSPYITPEEEDFTLYFLESSKEGYCIHFATAAAQMLRSLHIPARIASGFIVTVPPSAVGKPVDVTDGNAHAWVEVYIDNVGWIPFEATPSTPGNFVPARNIVRNDEEDESDPFRYNEDEADNASRDRSPDRNRQDADTQADTAEEDASEQTEALNAGQRAAIAAACTVAAFVAFIIARRGIVLARRQKRFRHADTNMAVIYIWRHISRLSRYEDPPKAAETLAQRARFSRHIMSEEQRGEMENYAFVFAGEVYGLSGPFLQLWLKWGVCDKQFHEK